MRKTNIFTHYKLKKFSLIFLLFIHIFQSSCQISKADIDYQKIIGNDQYDHPAWSPDGKKLVYEHSVNDQITILDLENLSERTTLLDTENIFGRRNVFWLDNDSIVYVRSYEQDPNDRIATISKYNVNHNVEEEIGSIDEFVYSGCWSRPEQKMILLVRNQSESEGVHVHGNTIAVFEPSTSKISQIFSVEANQNIIDIACNQQQGSIALIERESGLASDKDRLLSLDLNNNIHQVLYETSIVKLGNPTWSPNGNWLAFITLKSNTDRPFRGISLISATSKEPQVIMNPNYDIAPTDIIWSPISNELLIRSIVRNGSYELLFTDLTQWLPN